MSAERKGEMEKCIEVTSLNETAYLESRGFQCETERDGIRFNFMFPVSPELEQARRDYWDNAELQAFVRSKKALRHRLWGGMRG